MILTVLRIRYDYETKTGDMVAICDEHLFKGDGLSKGARHHLPEVTALFTNIDPNVKAIDWYDVLAPLTCRYTRKKGGTWRFGDIHGCEDFDWDESPADVRVEVPTLRLVNSEVTQPKGECA